MATASTFWLLDGQLGWHLFDQSGRAAGDAQVIRLGAAPGGPLSFNSPDGSLGGLVLPRGMAIDASGITYLLGTSQPWIKRFDPETRKFVLIPGFGGDGSDARRFQLPAAIAIAGDFLYVADQSNRRVAVFGLADLALRFVWQRDWEPVDIAARGTCAYILDHSKGRVFCHCAGHDRLKLLIGHRGPVKNWTRIVLDRDGRIYLFDASNSSVDIFNQDGTPAGDAKDSSEISGHFDAPAIRLDSKGRFCLPESLARLCDRRASDSPPSVEQPLVLCSGPHALIFSRDGEAASVEPAEPAGPAPYLTSETWFSEPLDSKIYRCQWHRIQVEVPALPPGTRIVVSTFAAEQSRPADQVPEPLWETRYTITGPPQRRRGAKSGGNFEFLVQSREGQYLSVRVQLIGDGFGSPEIASIRAYFPRDSYLAFLPAIYMADDESRSFLDRFLSIVQTRWDEIDAVVKGIAAYFDPKAVPAGPFLAYLARWLALPLEGTWTEEQKRALLEAAPQFYKRRGTVESLRIYLRAYLQNLSGASSDQMKLVGYPQFLENFRERRYLMLSAGKPSELGAPVPLWGPGVTERCQLDVFSQVGDVRMISTGDPERDVFHTSAHRFRVFIPAAWVRDIEDERKIRRALDTEKPAHTQYDLCLVEPRFRVGVQSTVGIDTVIGAWPAGRLGCLSADAAASREPSGRLGYDIVLAAGAKQSRAFQLAPATRLGIETILK